MIGIHIASHGDLCSGILNSLEMIIGKTEQVSFTKLCEDSDIDEFREEMLKKSKKLDTGNGVIVCVDMFGATPCNTAMYNSKDFPAEKYKIIAGFNLPILIEAIVNRENMSINQLIDYLETTFHDTVSIVK